MKTFAIAAALLIGAILGVLATRITMRYEYAAWEASSKQESARADRWERLAHECWEGGVEIEYSDTTLVADSTWVRVRITAVGSGAQRYVVGVPKNSSLLTGKKP